MTEWKWVYLSVSDIINIIIIININNTSSSYCPRGAASPFITLQGHLQPRPASSLVEEIILW